MNLNEKCVNCGITNVPLMIGLDGNMHCADHIGMLIPKKAEDPKPEQEEQPYE